MFFDHDGPERVLGAMTAAALRLGVRVRSVIDSFGSSDLTDDIFAALRARARVTFLAAR